MKAGRTIRVLGTILVVVGIALIAFAVIFDLIDQQNMLPATPIDTVIYLVTNAFTVLLAADTDPTVRAAAAGVFLVAIGVLLLIIGFLFGAFGKTEPQPAPTPPPSE